MSEAPATTRKPRARKTANPLPLKQRLTINFARAMRYVSHHLFKAVLYPLMAIYVTVSLGTIGWLGAKLNAHDPAASEAHDKPPTNDGPRNYLVQKPPVDPIVVSDRSSDPVKIGSWLPPEDRLNDARLNGSWRDLGPHEYYWQQDQSHRPEIRVPGGGKWIARFDNQWEYIGTDKPPSN